MLSKSNGAKTVPQIFVNGTHIGDCDHIHHLDQKGELDKILKISKKYGAIVPFKRPAE